MRHHAARAVLIDECRTSSSSRRSTGTRAPKEYFDQFHERARSGPRRLDVRARPGCVVVPYTLLTLPGAGARHRERPQRPGDPGAEPRLVHGPLLRGRVHPPPRAVHGQVAAVQGRGWRATSSATAACSRSGADTTTRRRSRPRSSSWRTASSIVMYCEGGRSRTGKIAERGQARDRAARARVRSAGRPGRDPRVAEGPQLEAPGVPEGDHPVRRAVQVRADRRHRRASSSRSWPITSSSESASCTPGWPSWGTGGTARAAQARARGGYAVATAAAGSSPSSSIADSRILNFCTFPVTVIGKRVDELHVAGDLVVGDLAPAELAELLLCGAPRPARSTTQAISSSP